MPPSRSSIAELTVDLVGERLNDPEAHACCLFQREVLRQALAVVGDGQDMLVPDRFEVHADRAAFFPAEAVLQRILDQLRDDQREGTVFRRRACVSTAETRQTMFLAPEASSTS